MRTLLVLRQLTAVLDRKLAEVTRPVGLTSHDVLVLGWLAQQPGISGSRIADLVGRRRQNVQRSLERLEKRGLAERYRPSYRDRTAGWGMTAQGAELWAQVHRRFLCQQQDLERRGVMTRSFLIDLDELASRLMRSPGHMSSPELIEVPPEPRLGAWDL